MNTAHNLYHSILLRAADEWGVEYEDLDRDIGQQFDPVVRFLAGACASELERVYQHLHETEGRLQDRLTKILLPEYYHLPMPAQALATATPAGEPLEVNETTGFALETQDNPDNIAFSPLFPARLLPVSLKLMATEHKILDINRRHNPRMRARETGDEFGRILLGFESTVPITNWQGASLWFDLRGLKDDDTGKARLFATLPKSRCFLNGREMNIASGLPEAGFLLEDYLNGNERLQSWVRARYERQFLTFTDTDIPETEPQTPQEFLPRWFANSMLEPEAISEQLSHLDTNLKQPLHWLEIHLAYPVELKQLETRLMVRFNVFPVVNRRLCGAGNGEHHYLQTTSIKWLHLQPKEDFVAIRKVYEERPPEYQTYNFKPFSDFKEDRKPAYTLRHGGIGRWDDFNAWQRLAYVVAVLQENYQHNELIQKAAASLSLEDVHHLLGRKIAENATEPKPTRDIYVLLHTGISTNVRVRVEYWTSIGIEANGIPPKTGLRCTSRLAPAFEADSIELVTTTSEGRNPLEATEQLDAMKSALLSRGRIVTREDVKSFCSAFLQEKLLYISVQDGVGLDARFDLGMTRLLDVRIKPAPLAAKEDWEGICQQLQRLLEQKSASSIPIRVGLTAE